MTAPTRVRYVNRDHSHRLYGQEGVVLLTLVMSGIGLFFAHYEIIKVR